MEFAKLYEKSADNNIMSVQGILKCIFRRVIILCCAFCVTCVSCSPPYARTVQRSKAPRSIERASDEKAVSAPVTADQKTIRQSIVKTAKAQIGVPYRRGGNSPNGFDCSGLTCYVYRKNHIGLERTAGGQFEAGQKIGKKGLRPGDLVFFKVNKKTVSHVGIYIGKGRFVHAPSTGKKVEIETLSSIYWKPRFCGAARYL